MASVVSGPWPPDRSIVLSPDPTSHSSSPCQPSPSVPGLPRFRGGRKVAPQLQRMMAEDLIAEEDEAGQAWAYNKGYLGYTSILQRDYPVALGILVISSVLLLVGNILSDMIYVIVDPRIRFQ